MSHSPARVNIPGSKSLTNRALLMAALAQGTSHLSNTLDSDDTRVMQTALRHMGVSIENNPDQHTLTVQSSGHWSPPKAPLHLGNAGTAVRFLTAILSHQPFTSHLDGDARMRERPLNDLIQALTDLGATLEHANGCPPLTIHGHPLTGNEVRIQAKNSSQYTSALLMLAPLLPNGLTLHLGRVIPTRHSLELEGEVTSKPYLDLTVDLMNKFYVQVERRGYEQFSIQPQPYQPTDLTLEGDASAATYFFGLAAITGTTISVSPLARTTRQPDIQLLDHLEAMGCTVEQTDEETITITGPEMLEPLGHMNANDFPDGAMTLAVVSAFAKGETHLTGLHNLRIKESDRLHALATELQKLNVAVTETDDSLLIHGNPEALEKGPTSIATYSDHRMAMCFGMAQSRLPQLTIENPTCVNKTYPNFWQDLHTLIPKLQRF